MIPSKYQSDIFDAFDKTNRNLCIEAGPGSGKSTILKELAKRIPRYKKAIVVAFNKSIVEDIKSKLPFHVECQTLHSYGFGAIRNAIGGQFKLNQYKTLQLSDNVVKPLKLPKKEEFIYKLTIQSIIDFARITHVSDESGFKKVVDNYDIVCKNGELSHSLEVFDDLNKYNRGRHKQFIIDFVDMLYFPVFLNLQVPQYDVVLIDELQDMSPIQHLLLYKMIRPGGRIVGVGDDFQSIYNFIGADTQSITKFKNKFDTLNLPLSISYRLPKSGVKHAQEINEKLESNPANIEGIMRKGTIEEIEEKDYVVCRNTRPLVDLYFHLLEMEKKATIVGKDTEKGLLTIVNKLEDLNKQEALFALEQEKTYIYDKLKQEGVENPKNHYKYIVFEEKADIIALFIRKYDHISVVKQKLHEIFDENRPGVKLMTIHRAKGLENDIVFYLTHYDGKKLIPSKYATTKEQLIQERNLDYVARTRHKQQLIYITI